MEQTQYIKHESAGSRERPDEGAFEAYINTDLVDENPNPGELDMANTDMLCYLMDSDMGSISHLMDPMLDPTVFYYDNLLPTYESYLRQNATPSSDPQLPQPKRKAGRRKATKSSPFDSELNDLANRPDLILSPKRWKWLPRLAPRSAAKFCNKISARNFRLRRKEYVSGLEAKASKYDEDTSALRAALDRAEADKAHLRSCVDDLVHKFKLLTTQIPELRKFKELDPLYEITTSPDGQLVPATAGSQLASSPTQTSLIPCRISFDPPAQENDPNCHFTTPAPAPSW
ncbi:hypothetical protein L0F63_004168 [Massospora cicadina]|nr:hypothetical protein L0F63_004168 [Massospora cicadina]